jgi:hypothetical protein
MLTFKIVYKSQLKEDTYASLMLDRNDDDEKIKNARKSISITTSKGRLKHKHDHVKCREHDEDDDHCII